MSKDLTEKEKKRLKVVRQWKSGRSELAIARKLDVTPKFVTGTLDRLIDIGSVKDRPRTGRPCKLSESDRKRLVKAVKGRERRSTRKTAATFKTKSGKVSKNTVQRTLRSQGLIPHRKKRIPKLTQRQKAKRVEFAKEYRREDWTKCAFWDEKRFELHHPSNPKNDIVWDERGQEYFREEEKFPKSIMVGLAITVHGPTRLVIYPGTVDAPAFIKHIVHPVADINKMFGDEKWTMVMDKASCHTAKVSQDWLAENVPKTLPPAKWPTNSPDLSAIEGVFGFVQDIVDQKAPQDLEALKRIVRAEFKKLDAKKCKKFISALPGRLKRIIESNGEYCYD